MSRIGNQPITIPNDVTLNIIDGGDFGYKQITVSGSKGELTQSLRRNVELKLEGNVLTISRDNDHKESRALHGLYRALIANMITGVSKGFTKELHIEGIGYRAQMLGSKIELSVGYSHKILLEPPVGVSVNVVDQTEITVTGIDKQKVGEFANKIRATRKPEPYKGKGVRYKNEHIIRKDVKSGKK